MQLAQVQMLFNLIFALVLIGFTGVISSVWALTRKAALKTAKYL